MKNKEAAINHVQYELKEIFSSFVNGGYSLSGYALYPIAKSVSNSLTWKLSSLVSFIKLSNALDFLDSLKKFESLSKNLNNAKNFAMLLSSLYLDFDKNKKNENTKKVKVSCRNLDQKEYIDKYLMPVLELKRFSEKEMGKYVVGIYVHGSLSTLDYVKGWSDFDTLAIISKNAVSDYKNMIKLRDLMYTSRKFLCKVDPLQHHGHLIFTEYDFDYYCEAFFPLVLFKYSKSLLFNKHLEFKLRDSTYESIKKFKWFADYFMKTSQNKTYCMNSYDLKFFLHAVTLFPTMYLQAKGRHVYKKFSFEIARKDFNSKEWSVIDYVSSLRKNWKSPESNLATAYANINPVLAYQLNSKYWDLRYNLIKLNNIGVKKLVDGMGILAGSAERKVLSIQE